jgi:hypothetical protein
MKLIEKIKFSLLLYFSFRRIYKYNTKATKELNKYYWIDGNSFNIIKSKWRVENGIPLGLYTHSLDAPLVKRVNITGMCEYAFALAELDREDEQHIIVDFIEQHIHTEKHEETVFSYWDLGFSFDANCYFVDGMGQGQMLSLLTRYSINFPNQSRSELIQKISNSYLIDLEHAKGFVLSKEDDVIFEEYSRPLPCKHVLNGWIYAITGLYDYILFAEITKLRDESLEAKKKLLAKSLDTLARHLPNYDLGYWSTYQQPPSASNITSMHYQVIHIAQLRALFEMTGRRIFLKKSNKFLYQYLNPFYRVMALFSKAIIANLLKHGRLYRKQ